MLPGRATSLLLFNPWRRPFDSFIFVLALLLTSLTTLTVDATITFNTPKSPNLRQQPSATGIGLDDDLSRQFNIYGNLHSIGYYYTFVYIGNPPQRQTLIIDTGSSLLTVATANCNHCGKHRLQNFDRSKSISAKSIECHTNECSSIQGECDPYENCRFTQTYYEGSSIQGNYVADWVQLLARDDKTVIKFMYNYIAAINDEGSLIYTQKANGIFPLGCSIKASSQGNDDTKECSFLNSLLTRSSTTARETFALCLGENGGTLQVGSLKNGLNGIKGRLLNDITWVPMVDATLHAIQVKCIEINKRQFYPKSETFMLDSGSTATTLEPRLYDAMDEYLTEFCNGLNGTKRCFRDKNTDAYCFDGGVSLPVWYLVGLTRLEWHPKSYAILRPGHSLVKDNHAHEKLWSCMAIAKSKNGNENVLGATFFKNQLVAIDMDKQRVGIARATCPETSDSILGT